MEQAVCPECNSIVKPGDRVCWLCGEELAGSSPVPSSPPAVPVAARQSQAAPVHPGAWYRRWRFQAAAAGVLLVVLVLSISLLLRDSGNAEEDVTELTTARSEPAVPDGVGPSSDPPSPFETMTTTEPEVDEEELALQSLHQLADEGLARTALDGRWVAQLTSKPVGIIDPYQVTSSGSHTFMAVDILEQVQNFLSRPDLGDVFLLRSTDYGKRQTRGGEPLWVVFADAGFSSPDQVWAWCESTFPYRGDELENACAVRRLNAG